MRGDRSWSAGLRLAGAALVAAVSFAAHASASFDVINTDQPGIGLNDATPVAPVGGNAGRTLGEQRQIVFATAAKVWGSRLNSDVPVQVLASFAPLECTKAEGVLGAAAPYNISADFPNAKKTGTWYPSALANKLAGVRLFDDPDPMNNADIVAFFNGDLGKPGCLEGLDFYLGLDGKAAPNQVDLLTTVLHEFGHGLGFLTFTDAETGNYLPVSESESLPSIWDHYLFDTQQRRTWVQMTAEQRARSAKSLRSLVWSGERVARTAPRVLTRGTPELFISGGGINAFVPIGPAAFGPPVDTRTLVSAELAAVVDQPDGLGFACTPLNAANASAVRGRVAIVDRGGQCDYTVKVKNAQRAGAKAVLVADTVPGTPPNTLGGEDDTITIPSARISQEDGVRLKASFTKGMRHHRPYAVLFTNMLKLQGADYLNRVYMWSPNPTQPGSSVSHYDVLASPNLLMEPFDTPGLEIAVSAPNDLTLELLQDIGW